MISPPVAVAICVVLAALGGLILLAVSGVLVVLLVRKFKGKKGAPAPAPASTSGGILPGLFGGSSGASPLVQELEKVVVQAIHSHAQAAINTAAAQFLPGLKPFIPLFEQAAAPAAHQMFAQAQQLIAEAQKAMASKAA